MKHHPKAWAVNYTACLPITLSRDPKTCAGAQWSAKYSAAHVQLKDLIREHGKWVEPLSRTMTLDRVA
jgi:hypothetical protein